ncbi:MAG: Pregnancy-associated plasma protein-A [Chitinophagaceae bacterium]|nr:Pregnancy-associated plasma protein-A [Chitinophagaceae bacterium]
MKKITLSTLILFLLFTGCKKNTTSELEKTDDLQVINQRSCAANEVLEEQLSADPGLRIRMEQIETFTKKVIATGEIYRLVNGVIEIPVVVNVLYKTAAENISPGQIQSQIDVLNADYNSTNSDLNNTPSLFKPSIGKVGVRFVLSSIIRKQTNKKSWSTNDAMKKSSQGGIDPTDPAHDLNMWSCNLGQGLLGYAQFPGGNPATDGVVILYSAFGSRNIYPGGTYISKYDLGRTASHEVGHWMNLRHIWGDDGGSCSGTDYVADTPNQGAENYGCPSFPHVSCSNNGDMSMNYMDYTDDACMYMFTNGQAQRMLAVFAAGGPRAAIGQ